MHLTMLFQSLFAFLLSFCVASELVDSEVSTCNSTALSQFLLPRQMANYIEPHDLAEMILEGSERFLIIDVRDDDYEIGKVAGSVNFPFRELGKRMNELVDLAKDYEKIVFHCHFSAVRGPKSASLFRRAYPRQSIEGPEPEILILRGGFHRWQETYRSNPLLYTEL